MAGKLEGEWKSGRLHGPSTMILDSGLDHNFVTDVHNFGEERGGEDQGMYARMYIPLIIYSWTPALSLACTTPNVVLSKGKQRMYYV
jgi:hypothetical protein